MTGIWAVRIDHALTRRQEQFAMNLLPPERRGRIENVKRRAEPLCAYAALLLALKKTVRWNRLPEIALSDVGKPSFPGFPEVCFNLSHTDGAALTGISPLNLGVDIEKIRPMNPEAMRRLAEETDPNAFFRRWVCREAVAKRDGSGFRALMEKHTPNDPLYRAFEPFPGYAAGAAMSGSGEFTLHCCTVDALLGELEEIL